MKERLKNAITYAFLIFNLFASVCSVYSVVNSILSIPTIIVIVILIIIGVCILLGDIVNKAFTPIADSAGRIAKGCKKITDKYKTQTVHIESNFLNSNTSREVLDKEILKSCICIIRELSNVLERILNDDVRVCVKLFCKNTKDYLYTYCRDSLDADYSMSVEHKQRIELRRNTDFLDLYIGDKSVFIGNDLKKDYVEGKYKNTSNGFDYSSTIVVPICALKPAIGYDKTGNDNDVMGFLCVDSAKKNAFMSKKSKWCVCLIDATADLLYKFLSKQNVYYGVVKKNKPKKNTETNREYEAGWKRMSLN